MLPARFPARRGGEQPPLHVSRGPVSVRLPLPVRRRASRVARRVPVRIAGGPNRGRRWSLAAAGRGFWSGGFEPDRIRAMARMILPGDRFWDGGAHQGYVTLMAAGRVGPEGVVYAFEPSPYNRWYLRTHVRWNALSNAQVLPVALGGGVDRREFREAGSSVTFRLGGGRETVPVRTIPSLIGGRGLAPPTFLKLDVEGAEAGVLEAGAGSLSPRAAVMVAVHSRESYRRCRTALEGRDFRLRHSARLSRYLSREGEGWPGDPDLVAIGPERPASGEVAAVDPFFAGSRADGERPETP